MSYDLMVFRADSAPRDRQSFMKWYEQKIEAGSELNHDNTALAAPELQAWLNEMKEIFPASDETLAAIDVAERRLANYWLEPDLICITFPWNFAEDAYHFTRKLAEKHKLGFFDVSADEGDIVFPPRTLIVE